MALNFAKLSDRNYPRFSYSDPKNTKSAGPFIIHNLPPRGIMKITYSENKKIILDILDFEGSLNEFIPVSRDALKWFEFQPERIK